MTNKMPDTAEQFQIVTFYEFKKLALNGSLDEIKKRLRAAMSANSIKGTVIIGQEGFNATVCGRPEQIHTFLAIVESILQTKLVYKTSFHNETPFRKIDVKIKPEIVTLKQPVDIALGKGTHVPPKEWNAIISDPATIVLDARNDYEFRSGTFRGAINPGTEKFSDLPDFVAENLDPDKHRRIAMFCTGGIRCEKFAPYMKQLGFNEVFQLEGGILRYIHEISAEETLWEGECFVFDDRRTVDENLEKGNGPDYSQKSD